LDFSNETVGQFNEMRIITIAAIFIVLLVVLGSYPLALLGVLSIGLSITWAYAATLIFFNDILGSQVLFIIPLILFLLLYGIGMDYNIFILTRIREEAQKGKETSQAVVDAVDRTGGIITALALILASALGSLLLSSNRLLQGFGFAIGYAVILDAMVVRTYIVPAVMSLLGRRAWWGPGPLRRVKFDKNDKASPNLSEQSSD
jgi:RND superfamily putative drug exporter